MKKRIKQMIFGKEAIYFFGKTLQFMDFNTIDVVIDFGYGKVFSEFIVEKVKEIYLIDTSKNFMDICRERFSNSKQIYYHKLSQDNYLNFKLNSNRKSLTKDFEKI